jgi:hypothetical protein
VATSLIDLTLRTVVNKLLNMLCQRFNILAIVGALESAIKARVGNVGVCYSKHLAYYRL